MDVSENNDDEANDADTEESDEEMDDGEDGDRLSEVSETYSSSSLYRRSRIPVPVAGSYSKHLVSRDICVLVLS